MTTNKTACGDKAGHFLGRILNSFRLYQSMREIAHLIRVPEAARITGLPKSLLRKSFMTESKRPPNIPPPPPHKRIGRAVYILADQLPAWIEGLGRPAENKTPEGRRRHGRPTVAERMALRQHEVV